jgi:putative nucleotidyltransferase with HDIG domain
MPGGYQADCYQERVLPVSAARDAIAINERRMSAPSTNGGTDGVTRVSPFRGIFKSSVEILVEIRRILTELRGEPRPLMAWAAGLWVSAAAVAAALMALGHGVTNIWVLLGLSAAAGVAERQSVWVTRNIETSISFLPIVLAAVAFGALPAMLVGLLANIPIFGRPYLKWFVYTPARTLTAAAAAGTAGAVLVGGASTFGAVFVGTLCAALTYNVADALVNVGTLWIRSRARPRSFVQTMGPLLALSVPLYVPLVALLVYGYRAYSLWVVAAFLVSALAFQGLIRLYQQQRDAVTELQTANIRLARANVSFAAALVTTLDARDQYTAGHSAAVAIYARDIAARMDLPPEQRELAHLCGLVHDIGKIGLPPWLLEKNGPLTLEERRLMETHSAIGERILAKVEDYAEIAAIVRHHHERWDGEGYPDRVRGDEIPLLSRIICVADAYNAMTSDRPYRDAMPSRVARLRLAQAADSQFDTSVVAAFEAILAGATEEYRLGLRDDFKFELQEEEAPALLAVVSA